MYIVKESGQFSCRGFRYLNEGFFLLKIVVFVFFGTDKKITSYFIDLLEEQKSRKIKFYLLS